MGFKEFPKLLLMIKGGRLSPNAHAGTALGLIAHENKRSLKGTLIHAP